MIPATAYIKTRADWYEFYRYFRKISANILNQKADSFIEKECFIEQIHKYTQNNQVRICSRFYDCDHSVSTSSWLIPANWYEVERAINAEYDNAEGHGGCWLTYPDDIPEQDSRDLILEAHEDGHSHSVSEVRYESY